MSSVVSRARVASGAVIAGDRKFNTRPPYLFEMRLPSLTRTVTTGQAQFIMQSAAERSVLLDRSNALGGSSPPVICGVAFRINQTVTVPVEAAGTISAAASVYERLAKSSVNVSAGKAGMAYLMGRTDSIGLLMAHLKETGGFTSQLKAVQSIISEANVTAPRIRQNTDSGMVSSSLDNYSNVDSRPILLEDNLRRVYNGATGVTTPETGTQYSDVFYFPLTADGTHGVADCGMSFDDLFSADNQWIFNLDLQNNTGLYPAVGSGGTATTFGSFTVEVSLLYRVHVGAKTAGEEPIPPAYGSVWQWNSSIGTIPDGTAQNIAGELVSNHFFVGYLPTYDSSGLWTQTVDTATTPDYIATLSIIPPKLSPAQLNANGIYVRIGDGVEFDMPPGGTDQQTRGGEIIERWNARYRQSSNHDGFDPYHEGIELQAFTDAGIRAATTTLAANTVNGTIKYNGVVQTTLELGDQNDSTLVLGLGGLLAFPLAFSDRSANAGFTGLAIRSASDKRAIQVTTVGGFSLPLLGSGERQPVQCWRLLGPYATFSGTSCDPCGSVEAKPVVLRPGSDNAMLGKVMTASFTTPPVVEMAVGSIKMPAKA